MLISKRTTLKPLLESKNGVHLTAYIAHRGEPSELKAQLRSILEEAYEWLSPVMPIDERRRFLEPLDSLLQDDRIISQMKGNVGLFRNENLFRVLNIPIEVESGCHVATSFHVKPLLRWLQVDQEFLFLGVENQTVHLYTGSQNSFKLVDCILIPELTKIKDSEIGEMSFRKALKKKIKDRQAFSWLNELVSEFTRALKPKLFLAGDPVLVQALAQGLRYKNTVRTPVSDLYSPSHADGSLSVDSTNRSTGFKEVSRESADGVSICRRGKSNQEKYLSDRKSRRSGASAKVDRDGRAQYFWQD